MGRMCAGRTGFCVWAVTAAARALCALGGAGLSGASLVGAAAAGALVSRRQAYPRPSQDAPPQRRPAAAAVPGDRIVVAVVLGARGSVGTDALAPYEVFARSPAFAVYTASASRAASMLSGGLVLAPDYSLEDVDAGSAPEPDVVVVPAVTGPASKELAPLRDWITRRAGRRAHILGVCAGSVLLAETGLLDGHRATSHWSNITRLQRKHPQVEWVRGQRYVEDGSITTTAGVTSGVFGALRLVERLAGAAEAKRLGAELAYPGWRPGTAACMPVQRAAPGDLSYALTMAFPWFRPTVGVGLAEGAGEIDVAAAFDIYAGNSFAPAWFRSPPGPPSPPATDFSSWHNRPLPAPPVLAGSLCPAHAMLVRSTRDWPSGRPAGDSASSYRTQGRQTASSASIPSCATSPPTLARPPPARPPKILNTPRLTSTWPAASGHGGPPPFSPSPSQRRPGPRSSRPS
jgi:putative intracellular protease/amidase